MKKLLAKILVVVMVSLTVLNTGVISSFAEEVDDVEFCDEYYDAEEEAFIEAMLNDDGSVHEKMLTSASEENVLTATEGAKAAAGDAEFEQSIAAFPESYKGYLRELHKLYPAWKFVCDDTGLDWNTAVEKECGRDMQNSKLSLVDLREKDINVNWKSLEGSDYDWSTGAWTTYDTGKWVGASKAIVAYQMDPRNYLKKDPSGSEGLYIYRAIFEFLDNSFDSKTQTKAGLQKMINGTFLDNYVIVAHPKEKTSTAVAEDESVMETSEIFKSSAEELGERSEVFDCAAESEALELEATESEATESEATESETAQSEITKSEATELEKTEHVTGEFEKENIYGADQFARGDKKYIDIIWEAAETYKINPYVLTASILQEQGTQESDVGSMISGEYYDPLYGDRYYGYYNYFNNGASGNDQISVIRNGLNFAINEGWNTPEKAIKGGASKFADNYISKGQNTLYYKKFNVKSGAANATYTHQYMQNIRGAYHEAYKLGTAYKEMGILNSGFTFSIPVYKNMPSDPALYPKAICAPGCELKSLSVGSYSLSPSFSTDKYIYSVTVGSGTSSVKISAEAKNNYGDATVEGTGTVTLSKGYNIKKVTVKRTNGYWQSFYINIIRPESSGGGGSGSGGGGGGGSPKEATQAGSTFSKNWYQDAAGLWRIRNNKGTIVTNAWLCDDVVVGNGQNVWYLLQGDGSMLFAGLVQDNSGNYYSLETTHNGYYGMLRYVDGYYDCNGQKVYLQFSKNHNGSFGAVINADGLAKLKQIYGVTRYYIGNENIVYTTKF